MDRRIYFMALASAASTLACAADDQGTGAVTNASSTGTETSASSTGIETNASSTGTATNASNGNDDGPGTDGASDPGNSSVSGAGDGFHGKVSLYVAAGSGVGGLEPGAKGENTVDGWTVDYDKLIVMVGAVAAESSDTGESLHIGVSAGHIVDLRQASLPQILASGDFLAGLYKNVGFSMPGASEASRLLKPATDEDFDIMVKGGYSIYMEGRLTNPAGQSCNPEDPNKCTPAPMLTFRWGLAAATKYSGCSGLTVELDQTTRVTVTIPGDHWFRSKFTPNDLPRRAQWIADADLDHDGETTLEELKMIKASLLFTPDLDYNFAGAPIPVDTAHDFLEAQVRTIGLNTVTGCSPSMGCDNWAQDCPEGQKCAASIEGGGNWDSVHCVNVIGEDKPGDECTSEGTASGIDSCEKGAMCWGLDDMGVGTCVALCTGTPGAPTCPNSGMCTIANEGVLNLCLPGCDPLLQDCVDDSDACYPVNEVFACAPDASGEEGQANDSCGFINVCDPGLMCAEPAFVGAGCPAGWTGCCTPFCAFPDGPCPNPDQSCVQFFDPLNLPENDPLLNIGFCGIPQ